MVFEQPAGVDRPASVVAQRRGRPPRAEVFRRVETAVREVHDSFGGLPSPEAAAGIWADIWMNETHNSTAIEGNTLVLRQVEQLLRDGIAVGNRQLGEYLEVRGYADAAEWAYRQAVLPDDAATSVEAPLLTVREIRHLHHLAMTPVWDVDPHAAAGPDERPGDVRRHDIHPFPGGMTPPTHPLIGARLQDWLDQIPGLRTATDTAAQFDLLARLHAGFERVHPFLDGNGRVGRLVLDLLLVRLGYPPAVIQRNERSRYLRALRSADADRPGALAELLARAVSDSLLRFVVPALADDDRPVPIASLASPEVSLIALRNAAARGRLRAQRGPDGHWRSTRGWVQDYLDSRHRRSPAPSTRGNNDADGTAGSQPGLVGSPSASSSA